MSLVLSLDEFLLRAAARVLLSFPTLDFYEDLYGLGEHEGREKGRTPTKKTTESN